MGNGVWKDLSLKGESFCVMDIETTGLKPIGGGITEITALMYDENFEFERTVKNNLTNPLMKIPKFITDITNINDEMCKYKKNFKFELLNTMKEIKSFDMIIVAHNAQFEKNWIDHFVPHGIEERRFICTRALWLVFKDGNTFENNFKRNYSKLKQVCNHFNVEYDEKKAHRAEYDVLQTAKVAKHLINHFGVKKSLEISKAYINNKPWGVRKATDIYDFL